MPPAVPSCGTRPRSAASWERATGSSPMSIWRTTAGGRPAGGRLAAGRALLRGLYRLQREIVEQRLALVGQQLACPGRGGARPAGDHLVEAQGKRLAIDVIGAARAIQTDALGHACLCGNP